MTTSALELGLQCVTAVSMLVGPILLAIYQRQISVANERRDKAIGVELALIKAAVTAPIPHAGDGAKPAP